VPAVLKKLFKARRQNLFLDNTETLVEVSRSSRSLSPLPRFDLSLFFLSLQATYVVWALSFDKDCREQLIGAGMVETLQSFPTTHPGVKRGIDGALWNLQGTARPASVILKPKVAGKPAHVMISYSWGQKERMRQLATHLEGLGIPIWIDVDEMEGSVLEKMAEAVEDASAMIIGLSSSYKDSQVCRTEAEYGYKLKKPLIFVVAEDGFVPKGWLGAIGKSALVLALDQSVWVSNRGGRVDQGPGEKGVGPSWAALRHHHRHLSDPFDGNDCKRNGTSETLVRGCRHSRLQGPASELHVISRKDSELDCAGCLPLAEDEAA